MSSRPWVLAVTAALAGCSSVKIHTEYDPKTPFADYKTYAWNPTPAGPDQSRPRAIRRCGP